MRAAGIGRRLARAERSLIALLVTATPSLAAAAPAVRIDLPPARLESTVIALGQATGSSIGLGDPQLGRLPTPALHGRTSVRAALARILKGLPARAVRIDAQTWRIEAAPRTTHDPLVHPRSPTIVSDVPPAEIVVTASKRTAPLASYPGSAIVFGPAALSTVRGQPGGDAVVALLPTMASTELGPGRNKLFIRGIADSSFTGPTQATVSEYLGDTRLTYNAPDPDLRLYDVASVEVLEGPQGALYGAGSLGGILRIVPAPVRLEAAEGEIEGGISSTAHGAPGSDIAAMLNIPLLPDRLGLRAVGYRVVDGGYIDDLARGVDDVNRTRTVGGRVALHLALDDDWFVEAGGALQNIDSRDSQYAERGLPPLKRESNLAQPFDNDYGLGDLVISGRIGAARLVSTTSIVRHIVEADDDFTPASEAPVLFRQRNSILLLGNETRLSRTSPDGTGWLIGASVVLDRETLTRQLGSPVDPPRIAGVRNNVVDGALFGTWTQRLLPRLLATVGGRLSVDHLSGDPLDAPDGTDIDIDRSEHRFVPTIGLSWQALPTLSLFTRYEQGFRPGGLSAFGEDDQQGVQRFRSDKIGTAEAGFRLGGASRPWSAGVIFSYAHWVHIQSDLIDAAGLPFTANVGNGRVLGLEAQLTVRPVAGFVIDGSLFVNESKLLDPKPGFGSSRGDDLPNVAHVGGRIAATYTTSLGPSTAFEASISARYIGRSRLGVGDSLDLPQGRTLQTAANARFGIGRAGLTIAIENLLDQRGNQFAFGNPYDVAAGRQVTPLRPRTLRIGVDAHF